MSKDMMQGHKLRTWVLKLSFWGWWIIGGMACGIGTVLVYPYYDATFAELYAVLRNPFTNYLNGFGSSYYSDDHYQNNNWHQTYEESYGQPYQQTYQNVYEKPYENNYEQQPFREENHEEVKRPEGSATRGYYLNGVFHPYTEEELKELEKNGH